mmetsp:Transcript_18668/g.33892  ORF Transcript_18668/g.33892 Transcript_18668/m.33892 type:complete len:80 (+) Transcript_18668:815-1054(+)
MGACRILHPYHRGLVESGTNERLSSDQSVNEEPVAESINTARTQCNGVKDVAIHVGNELLRAELTNGVLSDRGFLGHQV